ncbi:hypothetical protein EJ03DRAFT_270306 [Teratosphaeria nubilosa]|uniref:Uncharacterized protein n=1 Tax=Teratosphaeria nubilosa TaxID=161662 RepID=A0A6G1LD09_9PEZI|nr:hypothetical protein EJ03DRAFT_270306 [Teratosphaeria nubilosa]
MSAPAARSYAAAATSAQPITNDHRQSEAHSVQHPKQETHDASVQDRGRPRRSPSPRQRPRTASEEEDVYVLTLQTNKQHHQRMTQLRNKYFPQKINKLEAHLTLFHALPGTKLESSIIPVIQDVAQRTSPFEVHATHPFRMKLGFAIGVSKAHGGQQAQEVHHMLRRPWLEEGFLSEQDEGGCRVHYTMMNKVDDQDEVERALEEIEKSFEGDKGTAVGLGLWRYDRGWWRFGKEYLFGA